MGILDEAIREHLELKRQHGAGDSELKELEDEAFGPAGRPGDEEEPADELTEAPTEFMQQPEPEADEPVPPTEGGLDVGDAEGLPEQPPPRRREPSPQIGDLQEGPEASEPEEPGVSEREEPAEEESPAMEHEAIRPDEIDARRRAQPDEGPEEPSSGPSTEEREAIGDQPTELYDVEEGEFSAGEPAAPARESDFEEDEEDDFFDEKRLSDELDQALEAPAEPEPEEQEDSGVQEETEVPEPEAAREESPSEGPEEDLLEETPDFLEEAPEADRLWFEQKPPKDFDFDD